MIINNNTGPQTIGQIKRHFETGNLFLSPEDYQRENAWDFDQKKLLIDTVFKKMDVPKFYLWKIDEKTLAEGYPDLKIKEHYKSVLQQKRIQNDDLNPYIYEVVDGQQRIRTMLEYIGVAAPNNNVYRGTWHEAFVSLNDTPIAKGKKYAQLNPEQQCTFDEYPLTIMVLEQATIHEVRDMFLRLQNGTPLNAQQKRNAMGSEIGRIVREILIDLPFFKNTVYFDNTDSGQNLVAAQMLVIELKDMIIGCSSRRLDKLYRDYKNVPIDNAIVSRVKKIIIILGKIFPVTNPRMNRSYALSLFWAISRIMKDYDIMDAEYKQITDNFEELDHQRLLAMDRDYSNKPDDEIYEDLSLSMARGTDGADGISTRHDILCQFLFRNVRLIEHTDLDPLRAFSHEEKLIIYRNANGICQLEHDGKICGRLIEFDDAAVDHIKPHSLGGRTELTNGRIAYKLCNISRSNRDDFDPQTMCHKRDTQVR